MRVETSFVAWVELPLDHPCVVKYQ